MFEEATEKQVSTQRRCAQLRQLARTRQLEKMAPCGLHSWSVHRDDDADPKWFLCFGEVLWKEPVIMDGLQDKNKKSRSYL